MGGGQDARLMLGDAILVRRGVKGRHVHSGAFTDQLTIPTQAIGNVEVTRGFNELDATIGGATVHVVNTHLEAYSADVRLSRRRSS